MKKSDILFERLKRSTRSFTDDVTEASKIAKVVLGLISDTRLIYEKDYGTEVNVLCLVSHEPDDPHSVDEIYDIVEKFTPHLDSIRAAFQDVGREDDIRLLNQSLDVLQEKRAVIYEAEERALGRASSGIRV